MFDVFFITIWFEYNNRLYQKVIPKVYRECEKQVQKIVDAQPDEISIERISCEDPKTFFEKRKDKTYGHLYSSIQNRYKPKKKKKELTYYGKR